jgi:site-specific DNA-methyltransferase (adenine-specific)
MIAITMETQHTPKSIVHLQDCMEGMKQFPDKYFELAIVDPPYGIGVNINMGRRKGAKKSNYHKFHGNDKEIPDENYFNELLRVSQNQIIWGGNYMTEYLAPSSCWLLWDKCFSDEITFSQFEMAWTSFNSMTKKYEFHPVNQSRIHPTQKPVALYKWLLRNYAKPGDKILDTHLGSGSSRIACYDGGFDFTGYEIDPDYFTSAEKRFQQHVNQLTLQL